MKPAAFAYHRPRTLDEALALLTAHGEDARPLAGGQSLVPMMNTRLARPAHLIDLNDLGELDFIRERGDTVEIGALTRHRAVERSRALVDACPILPAVVKTIGHHAIRERGTVGGSLALADPAAQWPLLAILLGARIELAGPRGRRALAAAAFFKGVFTTAAAPDELVSAVSFPRLARGEGWGYRALTRRHGDFAIVAAAATATLDASGNIDGLRLALAGGGDPPARAEAVTALRGRAPDATTLAELGRLAAAAAAPRDDAVASAAFRSELIEVLSARAVTDACERARATQ